MRPSKAFGGEISATSTLMNEGCCHPYLSYTKLTIVNKRPACYPIILLNLLEVSMLKIAVLAASAVFNVGIINPQTHLVESFLACDIDYNTAKAILSVEQPFHPDKVLGIFDNTARAAAEVEYHAKSTPCLTTANAQS
jgi:hypothetical protein